MSKKFRVKEKKGEVSLRLELSKKFKIFVSLLIAALIVFIFTFPIHADENKIQIVNNPQQTVDKPQTIEDSLNLIVKEIKKLKTRIDKMENQLDKIEKYSKLNMYALCLILDYCGYDIEFPFVSKRKAIKEIKKTIKDLKPNGGT